jgi:hypothetical protein
MGKKAERAALGSIIAAIGAVLYIKSGSPAMAEDAPMEFSWVGALIILVGLIVLLTAAWVRPEPSPLHHFRPMPYEYYKQYYQRRPVQPLAYRSILVSHQMSPNGEQRYCATCGKAINPQARFCGSCGKRR